MGEEKQTTQAVRQIPGHLAQIVKIERGKVDGRGRGPVLLWNYSVHSTGQRLGLRPSCRLSSWAPGRPVVNIY